MVFILKGNSKIEYTFFLGNVLNFFHIFTTKSKIYLKMFWEHS